MFLDFCFFQKMAFSKPQAISITKSDALSEYLIANDATERGVKRNFARQVKNLVTNPDQSLPVECVVLLLNIIRIKAKRSVLLSVAKFRSNCGHTKNKYHAEARKYLSVLTDGKDSLNLAQAKHVLRPENRAISEELGLVSLAEHVVSPPKRECLMPKDQASTLEGFVNQLICQTHIAASSSSRNSTILPFDASQVRFNLNYLHFELQCMNNSNIITNSKKCFCLIKINV